MTKRFVLYAVVIALAVILSGCPMPLATLAAGTGDARLGMQLPADETADVLRGARSIFTFDTIESVDLDVTIRLFDTDASGVVQGTELDPGAANVVVSLSDDSGNPIYSGMTSGGGLTATVQLPAAPADVTMTLQASGFVTRTVVISDMVTYASVVRTLSMQRIVESAGSVLSRSIDTVTDADGDGVPDGLDAFPNDPTKAFQMYLPSDGPITVAYEDLFGRANAGDADYNDFIATYSIVEDLDANGHVTAITVNAHARTKMAAYNHRWGIRIDAFSGDATLTGTYITAYGDTAALNGTESGSAEIDLFMNSSTALGKDATFTLTFDTPQDRTGASEGERLPDAPYNPYAVVLNTGHDIHLIGREPNDGSINPDDSFVDGDGFPWALLVPTEWANPDEGQRIEVPYPRFTSWRESNGLEDADWYDPDAPVANRAPYDITGVSVYNSGSGTYTAIADADASTSVLDASLYYGTPRTLQLTVAAVNGENDPDGDAVTYVCELEDGTALPSYLAFDPSTGTLQFAPDWSQHSITVQAWTVDPDGLMGTPFLIHFVFYAS